VFVLDDKLLGASAPKVSRQITDKQLHHPDSFRLAKCALPVESDEQRVRTPRFYAVIFLPGPRWLRRLDTLCVDLRIPAVQIRDFSDGKDVPSPAVETKSAFSEAEVILCDNRCR
jgi:hypothetical protein